MKRIISIIYRLILILVFIILLELIISNQFIKTTKYIITDDKVPKAFDRFKIVQLSDLHSKEFGRNNSRLLKVIDKQSPDLVVLTGDMINTLDDNYNVFYKLATDLARDYTVIYIVGNHEQNLPEENLNAIIYYLKNIGIIVLDNDKIVLERSGEKINIYGLWFNLRYYRDLTNDQTKEYYFGQEQIDFILGDADKNRYSILLTHNPVYFATYSEWGANLTLAGHMHGGMIRIPFKGRLFSPEKELYPEYVAGLYENSGSKIIVNTGLGNGGLGFRFLNPPEITVITLDR